MSNAVVIGNGESRSWYCPSHQTFGVPVTTWGCNAIHRDGLPDNLVAVDYGMQQEIYETNNWRDTQCWFANWSILPAEVAAVMFMGYDIPEAFINRNSNVTDRCVISGKDPVTVNEKIETAIKMHPPLDMKDLRAKMEKDVGVWITYVEEDDNINNIDFPIGWSAGNTALYLACQSGAEEVYILGFDLSSYDEPLNNIYKGTDNYLSSDAKGFNSVNWKDQMQTVFEEFKDVKFYWVDARDNSIQENNLSYLTKTDFCDTLKIL